MSTYYYFNQEIADIQFTYSHINGNAAQCLYYAKKFPFQGSTRFCKKTMPNVYRNERI